MICQVSRIFLMFCQISRIFYVLSSFKSFYLFFRAVRYEDLSLDIWNTSRSLLQFFDLDMEPTVESFLKIHTEKDKFQGKPKVWNTFRDPLQAPVHWKHELSFDEIKQIQDECQEVMRLWGYKTVSTKEELLDLVPIMPYKLWIFAINNSKVFYVKLCRA